jgi:hypothetical protein
VQAGPAELARATSFSAAASGGGDTSWKNRPLEFNRLPHNGTLMYHYIRTRTESIHNEGGAFNDILAVR